MNESELTIGKKDWEPTVPSDDRSWMVAAEGLLLADNRDLTGYQLAGIRHEDFSLEGGRAPEPEPINLHLTPLRSHQPNQG